MHSYTTSRLKIQFLIYKYNIFSNGYDLKKTVKDDCEGDFIVCTINKAAKNLG